MPLPETTVEKKSPPPRSYPPRTHHAFKTYGDNDLKTLIVASIILASGVTQAQSFDYEKAVGSAELYSTLATDGVVSVDTGDDGGFAYQEAVGSDDLFPTLIAVKPQVSSDRNPFAYQEAVGNELDSSLPS